MIFTFHGQSMPKDFIDTVKEIIDQLCSLGWVYRGGHEEEGSVPAENKEIFIPWQGFNKGRHNHEGVNVCHCLDNHLQAIEWAQQAYPTFKEETTEIQMYWVRNIYLLFGKDLNQASHMVIYYQAGNATAKTGTQYLVHAAESLEIPCFNIHNQQGMDALYEHVNKTM